MALSAGGYRDLILAELPDANGILADQITTYWGMYTDKATLHLTYLYTKRHAILALMGQVWPRVNVDAQGANTADSDLSPNLERILKAVQAEIDQIEEGTDVVVPGGASGATWTLTPARV